jgi:hypothetical protein
MNYAINDEQALSLLYPNVHARLGLQNTHRCNRVRTLHCLRASLMEHGTACHKKTSADLLQSFTGKQCQYQSCNCSNKLLLGRFLMQTTQSNWHVQRVTYSHAYLMPGLHCVLACAAVSVMTHFSS